MKRIPGDMAIGLAWTVATSASLAVLFIGEVLGQTPCLLCWFQRAFMFPLAIILGPWRSGIWASMRAWSPSKFSPAPRPAPPAPTTTSWSSEFRFR